MKDQRYIVAKERLSSLTDEELQRILSNIDLILFDTFNFDEGKFCPIAVNDTVKDTCLSARVLPRRGLVFCTRSCCIHR